MGLPKQEVVLEFLHMFTKLDQLVLSAVYDDERFASCKSHRISVPQHLQIGSLELRNVHIPEYLSIFSRTASTRTLARLSLTLEGIEDYRSVSNLLALCGPNIRSLDINLRHEMGPDLEDIQLRQ